MERLRRTNCNESKKTKISLKIQNKENIYMINITKNINNIKFDVLKIDDEKDEYCQEFNIDNFHINHNYFKRYNNINELYELLFKKLKNEDISISQNNGSEVIIKIQILFGKKIKEIKFIIKKTTNLSNSFFELYSTNNEDKEENYVLIEDRKIIKVMIIKMYHLFKEKILIRFSKIIFAIFCLVIMIIKQSVLFGLLNKNKKYIVFFDNYENEYVNSNDAFPIFDYYRKKGRKEAYYFLLKNSQLYYKLKKENNLDNI